MSEGLNIDIVLSATTLVAVATLAVKLWLASRGQKIGPQPFTVRPASSPTSGKVCDERHALIAQQSDNLFCRMAAAEQRIAKVEATVEDIKEQYRSIDNRLNQLLQRLP